MSGGINITLPKSEQDKFRAWVREQTAETQRKCQNLVVKHTSDLHRRAISSAPVNRKTGEGAFLRGSLRMMFSGDRLGGMVYTSVKYAPYQEFGTGKYVHIGILPGYEAYAMQFKGKGIRKVNIYPQSYLFGHFERIKKEFINDLNRMGFK